MKWAISVVFSVCAACASSGARPISAVPYGASSALSDFETGKIREGQLISISGFLTFGDDKHNVWESRKEYEYIRRERPPRNDPAWGKCISLMNYGKFRSKLLRYNGKQVKITGYISRQTPASDEINLGSCNDVSLSLEGDGVRVTIG